MYRSAAYAMLVSYAGKTVCHALLGVYVSLELLNLHFFQLLDADLTSVNLSSLQMLMSNRKRDRVNGPADVQKAADLGMKGATEDDNPDFRYVL